MYNESGGKNILGMKKERSVSISASQSKRYEEDEMEVKTTHFEKEDCLKNMEQQQIIKIKAGFKIKLSRKNSNEFSIYNAKNHLILTASTLNRKDRDIITVIFRALSDARRKVN